MRRGPSTAGRNPTPPRAVGQGVTQPDRRTSEADALLVPGAAGWRAVARLRGCALLGPVAETENRMAFLVAAGSAEQVPDLLVWLDWSGISLGLTARAAVDPGPFGIADSEIAERELPRLDLAAPGTGLALLLTVLADACHRTRLGTAPPASPVPETTVAPGARTAAHPRADARQRDPLPGQPLPGQRGARYAFAFR